MQTVISRKTPCMPKLNPLNERIKREYARHLKAAQGKSTATVDAALKAITRFETARAPATSRRFGANRAIAFKDRLASTNGSRSGEVLSASTQASTLAALKDFFRWLAWQPGFKSKIYGSRHRIPQPVEQGRRRGEGGQAARFPEPRSGACRDCPHADRHCGRTTQPSRDGAGDPDRNSRPRPDLVVAASYRHGQGAAIDPAGGRIVSRPSSQRISRPTFSPSATTSVRSSPNGPRNCKRACCSGQTIRSFPGRKWPRRR